MMTGREASTEEGPKGPGRLRAFLHKEEQARRQCEGVPGGEKSKELSAGQMHAAAGSE